MNTDYTDMKNTKLNKVSFLSVSICVNLWLINILQYLDRRVPSARAHDAAARMRRRPTHVEVLNRRTILSPTRSRTQKEKLFQRQFALKYISFRQSEFTFEIERRQNLSMQYDVFNVRCMFGDGVDDIVAELFALLIPGALFQVVRRVLNEA